MENGWMDVWEQTAWRWRILAFTSQESVVFGTQLQFVNTLHLQEVKCGFYLHSALVLRSLWKSKSGFPRERQGNVTR